MIKSSLTFSNFFAISQTKLHLGGKYWKQAGAELCQAQEILGLAELALIRSCLTFKKTLRSSSINQNLWSTSICKQIDVVFYLQQIEAVTLKLRSSSI